MKSGIIKIGHPVDVVTGVMSKTNIDIRIAGKIELVWNRYYSTGIVENRNALGYGWFNQYFCNLTYEKNEYTFQDAEGSFQKFTDPKNQLYNGVTLKNLGAYVELRKIEKNFVITQWNVEKLNEVKNYIFTYTSSNSIRRFFLKSIENNSRQGLDLFYDRLGRLESIHQQNENRTLSIQYNFEGLIEAILFILPNNRREILTNYEYDDKGRLIAADDALGNRDNYTYDNHHFMIRDSGKDGGVFSFRYDELGRCIKVSGLDRYDEKNLRYYDHIGWSEVTDSLGNIRRFQWNENAQVIREINPINAEFITQYDSQGRIVKKIASNQKMIKYEYDDEGNRVKIINSKNYVSQFIFNSEHLLLTFTDFLGNSWKRTYDEFNRLIETKDPLGNRYTLSYDSYGNLIKINDPIDNKLRQYFTHNGTLQHVTDWNGNWTLCTLDEYGRIVKETDSIGMTMQYSYNLLGNLTAIIYPDDTRINMVYDSAGNIIQIKDRHGHKLIYRYGPCQRLLEKIDSKGNKVKYQWGSEPDRLEAIVNPKGETYSYDYNAIGLVIREKGFDGRNLQYEYDLFSNRTAYINGLGERLEFKRDILGRITDIVLPDGTKSNYEYDSVGNVISATNKENIILFKRDNLGRVIEEKQNNYIIKYNYDSIGNCIKISTNLEYQIDYKFNANSRITECILNKSKIFKFERDQRGHEVVRKLPSGLQMNQSFDEVGQLTAQYIYNTEKIENYKINTPEKAIVYRLYKYDKDRLVGIDDNSWGESLFNYDEKGRLQGYRHDKINTKRFSYDQNDNLVIIDDSNNKKYLKYESGDRLICFENIKFIYDSHGRLVKKIVVNEKKYDEVWEFKWDVLDQLTEVKMPEGQTWKYTYDPFGRRIRKDGPSTTEHFIWMHDLIFYQKVEKSFETAWIYDVNSFKPICTIQNGQLYSIITDHIGTPREFIDDQSIVVWSELYDVWGNSEIHHDRDFDKTKCLMRFQGHWYDKESGLHYNRFRYYDPTIGRFISPDPIRLLGGNNLYAYLPNTVNWVDPYGLSGFLFRGDDTYSGGDMGLPLGSEADIMTPWDHVQKKESGQTSIFTSFSETKSGAMKFTDGDKVFKVAKEDLAKLQEEGKIKIITPDDVAEQMKSHPKAKVKRQANNVKANMERNKEVLIEGQIPEEHVKPCNG